MLTQAFRVFIKELTKSTENESLLSGILQAPIKLSQYLHHLPQEMK